jgi:hypothetical protein
MIKGCEEEEYVMSLIRECICPGSIGMLRGCMKEGLQKVASEPEN